MLESTWSKEPVSKILQKGRTTSFKSATRLELYRERIIATQYCTLPDAKQHRTTAISLDEKAATLLRAEENIDIFHARFMPAANSVTKQYEFSI